MTHDKCRMALRYFCAEIIVISVCTYLTQLILVFLPTIGSSNFITDQVLPKVNIKKLINFGLQ